MERPNDRRDRERGNVIPFGNHLQGTSRDANQRFKLADLIGRCTTHLGWSGTSDEGYSYEYCDLEWVRASPPAIAVEWRRPRDEGYGPSGQRSHCYWWLFGYWPCDRTALC